MKKLTPEESVQVKELLAVITQSQIAIQSAREKIRVISNGSTTSAVSEKPLPALGDLISICRFTNNPDLKGLIIRSTGEESSRVKAMPEPDGISSGCADQKYFKSSPDVAEALRWFAKNKKGGWFAVLGVERKMNGVFEVLTFYQNENGSMRELHWLERDGKHGWPSSFEFLSRC